MPPSSFMNVTNIFNAIEKKGHWAVWIFDMSGNVLLGFCNPSYKWEDVAEPVKLMEVKEIKPCTESLFLKVDFPTDATYQTEIDCICDGYEKIYDDPVRGPIYAAKIIHYNDYNAAVDFDGYSYATIERSI